MENAKPAAIAALTEEERALFASVQVRMRALEEQTRQMVTELMKSLTTQRTALVAEHRTNWEAVEKKYGLDSRKHYEFVSSTGEIFEHVCADHQHGGMAIVNLTDLLRSAVAGGPGADEIPGELPPKKTIN